MLLIGDIHINTRYQDKILGELRTIFSTYPDEKTIVFFGDYVYHFAYDRNALLQLYKLFLELFEQGKDVYILAGNHDRLGNSFVFEEAQKAFNIIQNAEFRMQNKEGGKIQFVTKPLLETIEGEEILLFPFFLPNEVEENIYSPKNERLKAISDFATVLEKSNHKHEQFSGYINKFLAEQIDRNPNLTIFHHYYINGTSFPGQKSKFNYKDIALNDQFLDIPSIKLISGHLHQPFTHTNYLCLGSVRSTSSLETNQNKYIYQYITIDKKITAIPLMINPQVTIRSKGAVSTEMLLNELKTINEINKGYFSSPAWNIEFKEDLKPNLTNISLTLNVEHIDYDKIDELIEPDLRTACKDIRLKKDIENMDSLLNSFKVSSDDLNGFSDRKNILQEYMQKKFGNDYPKYEKVLKELKLL
ncbi:MAG: metallophosphoesterase [Candidatus Absconditabacterales bacterium]